MGNRNLPIEIVNSSGQSVFLKESIMEKQLKINISQFSKGIDDLMGTFDGEIISEKIMLE
jgi:hypothetical protein